jgi:hypothetical protein
LIEKKKMEDEIATKNQLEKSLKKITIKIIKT